MTGGICHWAEMLNGLLHTRVVVLISYIEKYARVPSLQNQHGSMSLGSTRRLIPVVKGQIPSLPDLNKVTFWDHNLHSQPARMATRV